MTSELTRRTVRIGRDRREFAIEDQFWSSLEEIAALQGTTASQLVMRIDQDCRGENLSSAIRIYVIDHFMSRAQDLDGDLDFDLYLDDFDDEEGCSKPAPVPARPRWLN
jgi:predicted DNA-binding ribbon-helix-helix protein